MCTVGSRVWCQNSLVFTKWKSLALLLQVLNALPDQDSFYDVTDLLEEQGMEKIIRKHMNRNGTNIDLLEQFQIYEAVLQQEDGIQESAILQQIDNIRYANNIYWYPFSIGTLANCALYWFVHQVQSADDLTVNHL